MTIDFDKVQTHHVVVEGHSVRVTVDQNGRPISITTGAWSGGDQERIAKLAIAYARMQFEHAAKQKLKADSDAARLRKSTKTKQMRSAEFWGNEWLSEAHERNPKLRARTLALEAQNMIHDKARDDPKFKDHDHYKHRGQINEYRASLFLHSLQE